MFIVYISLQSRKLLSLLSHLLYVFFSFVRLIYFHGSIVFFITTISITSATQAKSCGSCTSMTVFIFANCLYCMTCSCASAHCFMVMWFIKHYPKHFYWRMIVHMIINILWRFFSVLKSMNAILVQVVVSNAIPSRCYANICQNQRQRVYGFHSIPRSTYPMN